MACLRKFMFLYVKEFNLLYIFIEKLPSNSFFKTITKSGMSQILNTGRKYYDSVKTAV